MDIRRVTYICPEGHQLSFGHGVSKRGKIQSGSPTVCSMGHTFIFAMFAPKIEVLDGDTPFLSSIAS